MIIFDNMIADMFSDEKLNLTVTELFIGDRKLKHLFCFYHAILLCCSERYENKFNKHFITKIPNKNELQ